MKTTLIAIFTAALAGCAATSSVVPIGADRFMMSKQAATGFTGLGNLKAEALIEANAFCVKDGRKMEMLSATETAPPYILGNYPRVELQFTCK